jgi:hypothetical protein
MKHICDTRTKVDPQEPSPPLTVEDSSFKYENGEWKGTAVRICKECNQEWIQEFTIRPEDKTEWNYRESR